MSGRYWRLCGGAETEQKTGSARAALGSARWAGVTRALPSSSSSATIVSMSVESLREVRDHFSEVVDRVEHQHERVTVTRNGRAAAVILSPDDLAELEETLAVLSDPDALADIREADVAYRSGDVVRGVDAVRSLRS
jgi:antitoxin YefM